MFASCNKHGAFTKNIQLLTTSYALKGTGRKTRLRSYSRMATSSSNQGLIQLCKGRTYSDKDPTHCLVCWPEEDSLSIAQMKKIVSPRPDSLVPDTFCKVKGLEQFQCKVVALGNKSEMRADRDRDAHGGRKGW